MTDRAHYWPPYTRQAPEPDDPAYHACTLKRLMERARQKSDEIEAAIREERIALPPGDQGEAAADRVVEE